MRLDRKGQLNRIAPLPFWRHFWQGRRTIMIISVGSLVRGVKPVEDDVAGQNFEATMLERS
jgi:hypothetical protein